MKVEHQRSSPPPRGTSHAQFAERALASSIAVFALTSIHHGYGAYVYHTPWRLHAVIISGAVTLLMAGLLKVSESFHSQHLGDAALLGFIGLGLLVAVGFGIFEGAYNHLTKDILYFSNVSPEVMRRLYPAGRYELPNNFFFELSGVLQTVPGVMTGYFLLPLVRDLPLRRITPTRKLLSHSLS